MNATVSKHSRREQFLLAVFPAAIVLAIYSVIFAIPLQSTQSGLVNELRQQESVAVRPATADHALKQLLDEQAHVDRLKNQIDQSSLEIDMLTQSWRDEQSRLETLERISELMRDFDLSIVSQGDESESILSQYTRELFELMDQRNTEDPMVFWQVEVKGTYFSVIEFLTAIDNTAQSIVPIGITMQSDETNASQKTWKIVFAI